jgi:hypothetical protein
MLAPECQKAVSLGIFIAGSAADLGVYVVYQTKSLSFALTFIWAFVAVVVGQPGFPIVQAVAALVVVVFTAAAALVAFMRLRGTSGTGEATHADALLEAAE